MCVVITFLDATFFADGEIPGREMSGFPYLFIRNRMELFKHLSKQHKAKIHFIHLNHTSPALILGSEVRRKVLERGFSLAEELQKVGL